MKKYIALFGFTICCVVAQAQNINDIFRYSQDNVNGTARFRAMSGAFGALGGDISSITVNPAGSVILANNQIGLSLNSVNIHNDSNYFGKKTSESSNTMDLNQIGLALVFQKNDSNWKKISFGINYENANSFDDKLYSGGFNPTNAGIDYFADIATGLSSSVLNLPYENLGYLEQQAQLAYQTYLIQPTSIPNTSNTYYPNIFATGNYYQENEVATNGYNGKLLFNFATQYKDILFLGANLNYHFSYYNSTTSFYEDYLDSKNTNLNAGIQSFRFDSNLTALGNGFSFQLGAIVKPIKQLRFGLALQSPTWMRINERVYNEKISTDCADCNYSGYTEDPGIENTFPAYSIKTPYNFTGSFAYVIGKRGLISFDYTLKDYSNTTVKPEKDFKGLNQSIDKFARKKASEYRVGGEFRVKNWSIRGGYRYVQSPYKDINIAGGLTSYSTGLGYNFGGIKIDGAYTFSKRDYKQLFSTVGLNDAAIISSLRNNITVSVIFEL